MIPSSFGDVDGVTLGQSPSPYPPLLRVEPLQSHGSRSSSALYHRGLSPERPSPEAAPRLDAAVPFPRPPPTTVTLAESGPWSYSSPSASTYHQQQAQQQQRQQQTRPLRSSSAPALRPASESATATAPGLGGAAATAPAPAPATSSSRFWGLGSGSGVGSDRLLQHEPLSQEPLPHEGSGMRSASCSNYPGYGSPIFGQGSDTIAVAFRSQLTSLENRLSRQITQLSRSFERRLEEATEGLDARLRESELGQPRLFRRLAEIDSQLKVLTEEMTSQNVRLDVIDARTLDRRFEGGVQRQPQLQLQEPLQQLQEPLQQLQPPPPPALHQQGGSAPAGSKAFTPGVASAAPYSYSYPQTQAPSTPSTAMPGYPTRRCLRFEEESWGGEDEGEGSPGFTAEEEGVSAQRPPSGEPLAGAAGAGVGAGAGAVRAELLASSSQEGVGVGGPRSFVDVVRSLESRSAALDQRMDAFQESLDFCLREARSRSAPELEGGLRETTLRVEGLADAIVELRRATEAAVPSNVVAGLDARLAGLEAEVMEGLPGLSRRVKDFEVAVASADKREAAIQEALHEAAALRESMEARLRALEPLASEPVAANAVDALRKLEARLQAQVELTEEKFRSASSWQEGTTAGLRHLEDSLQIVEGNVQTSSRRLQDSEKKLAEVRHGHGVPAFSLVSSELCRTSSRLQDMQKVVEVVEKTAQDSAVAISRLPWLQEQLGLLETRVAAITGLPSAITEAREMVGHLDRELSDYSQRLEKAERTASAAQATASRAAGSIEELRSNFPVTEGRLLNRVAAAEASLDFLKREVEHSETLRQKESIALTEKEAKKKAEADASTMSVLESVATSLAEIEGRLEGKLLQTMSKVPDDLGRLEERLQRRLDLSEQRASDLAASLSSVLEGNVSMRAKLGSWDEEFEEVRRATQLLREGLDLLSATTSESSQALEGKVSRYEERLQLLVRQQQGLEQQLQHQATGLEDSTQRVSSQELEVATLRGRVDALAEQGCLEDQFRIELNAVDSRLEAAEATIRAFGLRMEAFGGAVRSPTSGGAGAAASASAPASASRRLEERIDAMEQARRALEAKMQASDARIDLLLSSSGAAGAPAPAIAAAAACGVAASEPTAAGPSPLLVEPLQQQHLRPSQGYPARGDPSDPDLARAARAVFREVLPRLGAVGDTQDNLQRSLSALSGRMAQLEQVLYDVGPPPAPAPAPLQSRLLPAEPGAR